MATRRDVLRTTAVGVVGGSVLAGSAAADHFDEGRPSHVTITYDESYLDRYKPYLVMPAGEREKFLGMFGWVASSPEHDTNVCVYWCSYTHQDGWIGNLDSHYGDHEPVHVEVDKQTGDVIRLRASVYHWIKGEVTGDVAPLDGTNPQLRVISPWHQYTAAEPTENSESFAVQDLTRSYEGWLDNGLEEDLLPGSSTNPWKMRYEPDFWRRNRFGFSTEAIIISALKAAGYGNSGSLEA